MKLVPYENSYEAVVLRQMSEFFGYHHALVPKTSLESNLVTPDDDTIATLKKWQIQPNALYVIVEEDTHVGFIRICFRGENVAWIEDIFVDADHRGRGIASSAITAAEENIKNTPGYTAVCLEVSLRNTNAFYLYHKLGYTDLSLITVRKEFSESKRDEAVKIFGLDFNY